jgi:hypothetical protein
MTLIHPSPAREQQPDGPRLHALIVGVADYPYMQKGRAGPTKQATLTYGLGQVRSPKPSAMAVAKWLVEKYDNPIGIELGSVELLVSPDGQWDDGSGVTQHVDEPTFGNIQTAVNEWFERCNARTDNIALFYFCGHGMSDKGLQFLLPQDFGDPDERRGPWANCIDFDQFKTNMGICDARTQLFFVDACSDSPSLLKEKPAKGESLIPEGKVGRPPEALMVINAAAPGKKVDVPAGSELTCLAEALLKCLNGSAARSDDEDAGPWIVHTESLRGILPEMTCIVGNRYKTVQSPAPYGWGRPLSLHQPNPPKAFVKLDCSASVREHAEFRLVQGLKEHPAERGEPLPWYADLEFGEWELTMSFGPVTRKTKLKSRPPFTSKMVEYDNNGR